METIITDLRRIRRTGRVLLIVQRLALIVACTVGVVAALVLLDWLLRFPAPLRLALLLAGLAALGAAVWTYLVPALRFAPDLTTLALRVERTVPSLHGRLASSVEFAGAGLDRTNPLAARVVSETQRRAAGALDGLIRPGRTWRDVAVLGLALAIAGGAAAAAPALARIGLTRLFAPFAGATWPARTGVVSLMDGVTVRPRGPALPLRAMVTLGDPATTRVTATYRTFTNGVNGPQPGPWRSVVLTYQGPGSGAGSSAASGAASSAALERGVHERLVDSEADAIEFSFATAESETDAQRIELVPPPAIHRATLRATPPAYAASREPSSASVADPAPSADAESSLIARVEELGTGTDGRSAASEPLLEGSEIRLELELNKPLPAPADAALRDEWLARTVLGIDPRPRLDVDPVDPARWTLSWRLDRTADLGLRLVDEHGIANVDEIGYRIVAVADRDPVVTIVEPQADEAVAPTAVIGLAAEARDDLGVSNLAIEIARQRGAGDAAEVVRTERSADATSATMRRLEAVLDLAGLGAKPGETISLQATAIDAFELDGRRHAPARSAKRTLRVVTDADLAEQLRRQLAALRQSAIRIDQQEAELMAAQDAAHERGAAVAGASRRQAQVGERVAAQDDAMEALARRLERNRLEDPELDSTLALARDHLRAAGQASNAAAEALQRSEDGAAPADGAATGRSDGRSSGPGSRAADARTAAGAKDGAISKEGATSKDGAVTADGSPSKDAGASTAGGDSKGGQGSKDAKGGRGAKEGQASSSQSQASSPSAADPRAQADAREAQEQVRDELAELIQLLNRDEDAWALTRKIEKLADQVGSLRAETGKLGDRTVGRGRSELGVDELTELERIASAQRDAADQAQDLTDQLRDRAERQENRPAGANDSGNQNGVLRQAVQTAESRRLNEQLGQAARDVAGNRMQNAQAAQQSAQQTLKQMLQDLREGRRAKTRELQRQLASLVESIERLVAIQTEELNLLAAAGDDAGPLDARARAMIRLKQNTDGVVDEARRGGAETERIARIIGRGSDAQGVAIGHLRAEPPRRPEATTAEEQALERLQEALDLSKKAQQRAADEEAQRQRAELLEKYRDAQEKQVGVLEQTLTIAKQANGGRRALLEARRLGGVQQQVREQVAAIRDGSEVVQQSKVFTRAHALVDQWSKEAEQALSEGDMGPLATAAQARISEALATIIAALESSPPEEAPFDDGQNGGQGGGQGGDGNNQGAPPTIPPRSELMLLRGLQEQLYRQTRALDDAGLVGDARRDAALELGKRQHDLADLAQQMLQDMSGGEGGDAEGTKPEGTKPETTRPGTERPGAPGWPGAGDRRPDEGKHR